MSGCISFVLNHKEMIASFLVAIIGIIRLTAWGRAQATALDAVVTVVEQLGATEIKDAVAVKEKNLPAGAQVAIRDSVSTADPKKPTPGFLVRILGGLFGARG